MSNSIRKSDIVGRVGGDEFVVLLPDVVDVASAVGVGEKIRMALNEPFIVDDQTLSLSSSIGLALYPDHGDSTLQLAKNADCAMYYAKANGRNNVRFFQLDPSDCDRA